MVICQLPLYMAEEIELEKCNFRNFTDAVTLSLTLNRVIRHTVMHHSSTCMYRPNFIEIGQTFCGRTYGRTDGRTYWQMDIFPSNVIRSTWRSRPKKFGQNRGISAAFHPTKTTAYTSVYATGSLLRAKFGRDRWRADCMSPKFQIFVTMQYFGSFCSTWVME